MRLSDLDQPRQLVREQHALIAFPVDEKCRRRLHVALLTFGKLLVHVRGILAAIHTRVEGSHIEAEQTRKSLQVIARKCAAVFGALVSEQIIGILPEFVLINRTLGGLCRPLRFCADDGKIPIDDPGFTRLDIFGRELLQHGISLGTIRSLKVRIDFDRDRRIGLTAGETATLTQR